MNEKQQILSSDNFGENMAGVQGLLKKHDAFEADLALHNQRIDLLIAEGQKVLYVLDPTDSTEMMDKTPICNHML